MAPVKRVLCLAGKDYADQIIAEVKDYIENRRGNEMFDKSVRHLQAAAIAEYIANKKGMTLYETKADIPKK